MEIYRLYGPALLRKCERMLRNREDAEDIVQALFTNLIRKGQTDVDLAYLYRACTNRCLNLIRNRKKQGCLLKQQMSPMGLFRRTFLDEQVVEKDLLARLVGRLDKKSLEILVYHYFDDLTQEEIGDLMKISRRTVGKSIQKIRGVAQRLSERENGARV